jgi:hypothetical protein
VKSSESETRPMRPVPLRRQIMGLRTSPGAGCVLGGTACEQPPAAGRGDGECRSVATRSGADPLTIPLRPQPTQCRIGQPRLRARNPRRGTGFSSGARS